MEPLTNTVIEYPETIRQDEEIPFQIKIINWDWLFYLLITLAGIFFLTSIIILIVILVRLNNPVF